MIRCNDDNIWAAEEPQKYFGLSVGARMTVIRNHETGRSIVLSPIKPTLELEEELAGLGAVSAKVAFNLYHYLY